MLLKADLLLLSSSEPNGLCYIETAELDGETNLKVRNAIPEIAVLSEDISRIAEFDAELECEAPNERLNAFVGTLKWKGVSYPVDNENMLLRGCRLRNTKWCYGLVVFAGADTKLMKNGGKTKFKQTHIDKLLNYLIVGVSYNIILTQKKQRRILFKYNIFCCLKIVIFLLTMCGICTIACGIWESVRGYTFQVYLPWEKFISSNRHAGSLSICLLVFLSYLIILNTVVPISLYVRFVFETD